MLALILALFFGVKVYDAKSVVVLDTVSACMPMSELRSATEKLDANVLNIQELELQRQRHTADSTALAYDKATLQFQFAAYDSLRGAYQRSDSARRACVDTATAIERTAEKQVRNGMLMAGGAGLAFAVLTFFVGFFVGH